MGRLPAEELFRVASETDRFWCAREVRRFAREMGFDEQAQWELAIVAAELLSNAVRYAGSGTLALRPATGPRRGVEIRVSDPGGRAWTEPSDRPGLGLGLRTVRCLSDEVSIERDGGGGIVVTAARYLAP
jgi:anti-sigma regulatory factor (Ser/Thr protein kinase)